MANTCDYCHKPLSLMRRLRGEQFCSPEHLDAYSAQQAEFALERLAASVTEQPSTARPPLPKPAPRKRPAPADPLAPLVVQQERTVATSQEVPVMAAVAVQEPEPEAPLSAPLVEARVEQTRVEPVRIVEPPAAPPARETQYPVAPHLGQTEVAPRAPESRASRLPEVEPVEGWGRVSGSWSMPPFRSEPSDPRTWTAGKLTAQIPPASKWRELFSIKLPDFERNTAEAHPQGTLIQENGTMTALILAPPEPVWVGMAESVGTSLAGLESHLGFAAAIAKERRTLSCTLEWSQMSSPEFGSAAPIQGTVPFTGTGRSDLPLAAAYAIARKTKLVANERPVEAGPLLEGHTALNTERGSLWHAAYAQTLRTAGASLGWHATPPQQIALSGLGAEAALRSQFLPVPLQISGQATAKLYVAEPVLWRNWSTLKTIAASLAMGPVLQQIREDQWLTSSRFVSALLSARGPSIPPVNVSVRPTLQLAKPPVAVSVLRPEVRQAGPVKYSPKAIVVVPPPQFTLSPASVQDESRYVTQLPNGVWRLPRVRHTGYRSIGPFPRTPLRVPDQYLQFATPEMAGASTELRPVQLGTRQDVAAIPGSATHGPERIHPADYFAWPQPRGLKLGKMQPERLQQSDSSEPAPKRFGPGRAGLQSARRNADGLARA